MKKKDFIIQMLEETMPSSKLEIILDSRRACLIFETESKKFELPINSKLIKFDLAELNIQIQESTEARVFLEILNDEFNTSFSPTDTLKVTEEITDLIAA